jgi:hypothetical protein
MYDVYSRAIRELLLEETKNPNDLRAKLVVIKDHTFQYPWQEWDDPTKRALAWAKNGIVVSKRTAEDFKRKCKNSISLEPRFTLPGNQVLIGDQQFEQFFGANGTSWRGFYESYPNSVGYIVLSRVGFNPERDQAFLYIGRGCGGLCGEGYYVLLAKNGGGAWSVKHKDILWVSKPSPTDGTHTGPLTSGVGRLKSRSRLSGRHLCRSGETLGCQPRARFQSLKPAFLLQLLWRSHRRRSQPA